MIVREYTPGDLKEIMQLFYDTVHTINRKDYTEQQVNVWATGIVDLDDWDQAFQHHHTFVALEKDQIVGFGDIDDTGYLDRLYVHKDFQGIGIATRLCNYLEIIVESKCITVYASITAIPFFEKRGYKLIKSQLIERHGVVLTNYLMIKKLL